MKRFKKFKPYQRAVFKKEISILRPYQGMYSHFQLLVEMLTNVNFLISYQNKTPKIDPFLDMLSLAQTNRAL